MVEAFFSNWIFSAIAGCASVSSLVFAFLAWWRIREVEYYLVSQARLPAIVEQLSGVWRSLGTAVRKNAVEEATRELAKLAAHLSSLSGKLPGGRQRDLRSRVRALATHVSEIRRTSTASFSNSAVRRIRDELKELIERLNHLLLDREWDVPYER